MKKFFASVTVILVASVAFAQSVPKIMPAGNYAEAKAKVEAGNVVYLAVGVDCQSGDYAVSSLPGFAAGRYVCWKSDRPVMALVAPPVYCPRFIPVLSGGGCPSGTCNIYRR